MENKLLKDFLTPSNVVIHQIISFGVVNHGKDLPKSENKIIEK